MIEHDLRVPMRDGVELSLDLIRPDASGARPVVLVRTPYDKVWIRSRGSDVLGGLVDAGYALALVDCRGRFNSDGVFRPYFDEADDGYDTIEWIAAQPWCDGNLGTYGRSYSGQNQWFAASRTPPHLKAMVSMTAGGSGLWSGSHFDGGAFILHSAEWLHVLGRRTFFEPALVEGTAYSTLSDYYEALPLANVLRAAGSSLPFWEEMMQHPTYDDFWRPGEYDNWGEMDVPSLSVTGWWDVGVGCVRNFEAMRRHWRRGQKLVIGPWAHQVNQERALSGVDFGEHALIDLEELVVRFFDRHLRGATNGVDDEPPVDIFLLGANEWLSLPDWPPPSTPVSFYLHSGGVLSVEPPGDEQPDAYTYDPLDPVRTTWTMSDGPVDDRAASMRDDVLCYTSAPLDAPLDVVGWARFRLFASSSALDTDWHVRLCDVHPDGSARFLCNGVLRARFRESFEHPVLLRPGEPTEFEIEMCQPVANRFLPGHRIRLEVTSSWFNNYERNLNTGAENPFLDDRVVVAQQQVHHRRGLPSHLVLPVSQTRG